MPRSSAPRNSPPPGRPRAGRLCTVAASALAAAAGASAEPLPGMRGIDHVGVTVPDIAAAEAFFTDVLGCRKAMDFGPFRDDEGSFMADLLDANGVRTLMGPLPVAEGPATGQSILYFFAPWGLQLEAISYPDGMAYAADAETALWSTRDPAN